MRLMHILKTIPLLHLTLLSVFEDNKSAELELEDSFDFLFKIILVGDSNVGKTCVVQRFKSGMFIEKQQNTIGVDFTVRTLDIEGKKVKGSPGCLHGDVFPQLAMCHNMPDQVTVRICENTIALTLQVWDTAGQERFRTITQSYYRSAHGAMVAYDITRQSTFESVSHWIREVEQYGASNVILILIGNKSDLHANRQVLFEDACTLAEKHSVLAALETSAKEAQNIEAAFILMARELMARNGLMAIDENSLEASQFMLNSSHPVHGTQVPDKNCRC